MIQKKITRWPWGWTGLYIEIAVLTFWLPYWCAISTVTSRTSPDHEKVKVYLQKSGLLIMNGLVISLALVIQELKSDDYRLVFWGRVLLFLFFCSVAELPYGVTFFCRTRLLVYAITKTIDFIVFDLIKPLYYFFSADDFTELAKEYDEHLKRKFDLKHGGKIEKKKKSKYESIHPKKYHSNKKENKV